MSPHIIRAAKVITLINLKGGVAKTFTAWTLAGVLEEQSRRVLLVDCDVQGNLTGSFLAELDDQPGVDAFFDPAIEPDATRPDFWLASPKSGGSECC